MHAPTPSLAPGKMVSPAPKKFSRLSKMHRIWLLPCPAPRIFLPVPPRPTPKLFPLPRPAPPRSKKRLPRASHTVFCYIQSSLIEYCWLNSRRWNLTSRHFATTCLTSSAISILISHIISWAEARCARPLHWEVPSFFLETTEMRPIFIMKGKFVKFMSLSINRETKNLPSPSSCLVIELKQHFAKFASSVEGQG